MGMRDRNVRKGIEVYENGDDSYLYLPGELLVNDLQPAALSLCPAIADALESVRAAGARHALVCGSGPTVAGLFDDPTGARAAVAMLADRDPRPVAVTPWGARA